MSLEKQGPEKEQLRQCPLSDQGAGRAQHSTTVPAISPGGGDSQVPRNAPETDFPESVEGA